MSVQGMRDVFKTMCWVWLFMIAVSIWCWCVDIPETRQALQYWRQQAGSRDKEINDLKEENSKNIVTINYLSNRSISNEMRINSIMLSCFVGGKTK